MLRTRSRNIPSERTTKMGVAHLLVQDFLNLAPRAIIREIRTTILKGKMELKLAQSERTEEKQAA